MLLRMKVFFEDAFCLLLFLNKASVKVCNLN